jgi:hypothetical protein
MSRAFFTTRREPNGTEWFLPTDACRGPWDPHACHAGPPTGLLARASERLLPDQQLVRLTVDLTRPIPHAGFRIDAKVTRTGRTVSTTEMQLVDEHDRVAVVGRGMHLRTQDLDEIPTTPAVTPRLDEAVPGRFPVMEGGHAQPMFSAGVTVKYPPGSSHEAGPNQMWMRTLPLLIDEEMSPFQRICPLADCGNAISRNENPGRLAFMNTDLTIVLHRPPEGDWLGSDSVSRWEATGLGMSDALLFDHLGPVGRAVQSLIIQAVG